MRNSTTPRTGSGDAAHQSPSDLRFEQTVPRTLVHRAALSEVYIADSVQDGDREFRLAFQIPRAHCVWFDRRVPYHDPLSTAEAARQGVYVVVHRHIGVPAGLHFTLQRVKFTVEDLERYRDHVTSPLQGVLTLRLVQHTTHAGGLGSMAFEGDISVNGTTAMTMGGDLMLLPRDDYSALREYQRGRNPPGNAEPPAAGPGLDAGEVGRLDRRNAVIGEPAGDPLQRGHCRYPVIVDQRHPAFFDHAYDHAPGPLLLEAFRQAAIVTAHRAGALPSPLAAITDCTAAFTDFAELDARIECSAALPDRLDDGRVGVGVGLLQFGKEVATGHVTLRPYPRDIRVS